MTISSSRRVPPQKIVNDYATLAKAIEGLRAVNYKVVLTIGSWDMLHIGHVRYLHMAKGYGDVLVVGMDSDRGIKAYKGELRPVVPGVERAEMLSYLDCVDFVTPIDDIDEKGRWQYGLAKAIKPDVFIAVEDSYPPEQLAEIQKHCTELVVLPRQAENTSTSKLIQGTIKKHLDEMYKLIEKS
jgi:D-beta-D-heptose 7-phosphate kinase/D-beta-D-heptose 1-phosphate adenosyltransferase